MATDNWTPVDEWMCLISDDGDRLTHQSMDEDVFNNIEVGNTAIHLIDANLPWHSCVL